MLSLMYITNDEKLAKIADKYKVDRVWIDLEIKNKELRQPKILNTVISRHSIEDIEKIKKVLNYSQLIVRVNSIDEESKEEIANIIKTLVDGDIKEEINAIKITKKWGVLL